MKVYISGPTTGIKDYNFPAFFTAESKIKKLGILPLNPARNPVGLEYREYMDIAFAMVRSSDAIVTLPGWESSPGAKAEVAYAESIGLDIIEYNQILIFFK